MNPGDVFDSRYRIVRQIAEGGMGVVYEAEHLHTHRTVAIKCFLPEMTRQKEVVTRFQREATAAAAIGNAHIIDVLDMAQLSDGSFYMALEFLRGRDLATALLQDGPFSVGRVVHVLTQICSALSAAHSKGIVHRDLKPENLFLVQRDNDPDYVKVLDFGISKFRDHNEGSPAPLTRTNSMLGTPQYMAPEQIQSSRDVDHRADIFALGVIAYELLAGAPPFDAETIHLLILKICMEAPPSLREARSEIPAVLIDVIDRALAKDREDRFQDCDALRDALVPFANWDGDRLNSVVSPPSFEHAFDATNLSLPGPSSRVSNRESPSDSVLDPVHVQVSVRDEIEEGVTETASGAVFVQSIESIAPAAPASTGHRPGGDRRSLRGVSLALVLSSLAAIGAYRLSVQPSVNNAHFSLVLPRRTQAVVSDRASTPSPRAAALAPQTPLAPQATPRTHLEIATTPDDSEVLMDGRRIANPFNGELPSSVELHRLELRHPGYTTIVQDLSLEFPQVIRLRLRRGHGVEDRRRNPPPVPAPVVLERPLQVPSPSLPVPVAPAAPVPQPPVDSTRQAPDIAVPPVQQPIRHIEI